MNNVIAFLQAHETVTTLVAWWFFSGAVGAMPAPTEKSSGFYQWSYKFLNTLGANIARAWGTKVEASPNFLPAVAKLNGGQK